MAAERASSSAWLVVCLWTACSTPTPAFADVDLRERLSSLNEAAQAASAKKDYETAYRARRQAAELSIAAAPEWAALCKAALLAADQKGTEWIGLEAARGMLKLATDWAHYAEQMCAVLDAEPLLSGGVVPRPAERPLTRFEQRGMKLGHEVHDLVYRRVG